MIHHLVLIIWAFMSVAAAAVDPTRIGVLSVALEADDAVHELDAADAQKDVGATDMKALRALALAQPQGNWPTQCSPFSEFLKVYDPNDAESDAKMDDSSAPRMSSTEVAKAIFTNRNFDQNGMYAWAAAPTGRFANDASKILYVGSAVRNAKHFDSKGNGEQYGLFQRIFGEHLLASGKDLLGKISTDYSALKKMCLYVAVSACSESQSSSNGLRAEYEAYHGYVIFLRYLRCSPVSHIDTDIPYLLDMSHLSLRLISAGAKPLFNHGSPAANVKYFRKKIGQLRPEEQRQNLCGAPVTNLGNATS